MNGDSAVRGIGERLWGPTLVGGRRRALRRWAVVLLAVVGVSAVAVGIVGALLYEVADDNIGRIDVPALAQVGDANAPLNVLVVGSDSRQGLSDEEIEDLHLGDFSGQRGDSIVLVSITPDRERASIVSFPRDLLVEDGGRRRKLTDTFNEGPDHVVKVLQAATGVPIHHYVEVSIPGFIGVVDAIGGVRICLEEALHDDKSGADFEPGCHQMGPAESLAYVRSRSTALGDFDRIERQQTFIRALLDKVVATRTLVDVPRMFRVVERVASNVTTDQGLSLSQMRRLAVELRGLAEGTVPMTVVPGYPEMVDGLDYVIAYPPGAAALYGALAAGQPIESRGTAIDRHATAVTVWAAGRGEGAQRIRETLHWSNFAVRIDGEGPVPGRPRTAVHAAPGHEERAAWVAATLGAEVAPVPAGVSLPPGAHVVVVTGADA